MYFSNNKKLFKSIVALLLVVTFLVGIYIGRISSGGSYTVFEPKEPPVSDNDFNIFWDVWRFIESDHVDRAELDKTDMVYGAISGLLKSLDDPYSVFMEPQDSHRFKEDVSGKFEGIGAEIGIRDDVLTIIAPLEGTPAKRAGVQAGDKVLKIDDASTADLSLDEAVNLIRGPRGEEVVLTIFREGLSEAKEISIIRDVISIPIIQLKYIEQDGFELAHLQLYHFTETASQEFKNKVREIMDKKVDGLILDLRNNPGGYLDVAVDLTGYFLEKGKVVAIESFGDNRKREYKSSGINMLSDLPVVVLVNKGSASASEILAGALRDHKEIKLVGKTTFGKGSVQELREFDNGTSVKLTIAKWLTPNGVSISEEGLVPDIEVEFTEEDFENEEDPQLDKAVEVLVGEINAQ